MKAGILNSKQQGSGHVLIILHGLFGCLDNWQSMARMLSEYFTVITVDLRNHGKSFHHQTMNYRVMADDLLDFIHFHQIPDCYLMGHSMGGKVILDLLSRDWQTQHKVMILDIAPKAYPDVHLNIFEAMKDLPLHQLNTRQELDHFLSNSIQEFSIRQFILKNVDRDESGRFNWKLNLEVLHQNYHEISKAITFDKVIFNEICFVRGSHSNYITDLDIIELKSTFPNSKFETILTAGHWIHADQPQALKNTIMKFFK
ncbi:MAG: alpha/beta fold hydrolase [Saprospiraceae bacterium]|nr:alpha/beta fold hydrolase [Saprospiraceae bacterium]